MGPPGMEAGRAAALYAARPLVAAGNPPALARGRVSSRRRRRRPAGRRQPGQGEITGLEMEDAVAHYDTLDGRTVVEPSNEVFIYSPRFGAVRQVVGLVANEERQKAGGVYIRTQARHAPTTLQFVGNAKQNIQPNDQIGARPPLAMRTKQGRDVLSSAIGPRGFQDGFKPYENLAIIRQGKFEGTEMAFLARGANAAIAWSHTQAVQIILDRQAAMADVKYDAEPCRSTRSSEPPGHPEAAAWSRWPRRPLPSRATKWTSPSASTTSAIRRSAT